MTISKDMKQPNGSGALCKGVFWIKDLTDVNNSKDLFFYIPCNADGDSDIITCDGASKSGNTYNHERLWLTLPKKLTDGKPFNYYPRGRVEIKNGIADIYVNPYLYTDEVKNVLISEYRLSAQNGIKKIRFHADNSEHYRCHLNDG